MPGTNSLLFFAKRLSVYTQPGSIQLCLILLFLLTQSLKSARSENSGLVLSPLHNDLASFLLELAATKMLIFPLFQNSTVMARAEYFRNVDYLLIHGTADGEV